MHTATRQHPAVHVAHHNGDLIALRDLLQTLVGLQNDLHQTIEQQLSAMRRADVPAMQAAAARVNELTARFEHLDLQRHAVVSRLVPGANAADARLSEIVSGLPGAWRGEFAALSGSLRERMLAVAAANKVAQSVCREMCEHFRSVFESVAQAAAPAAGYERNGRPAPGEVNVLDARG